MKIFVTGDTHGCTAPLGHTSSIDRFSEANLERCGVSIESESLVTVAGDAGWCWDGGDRDRNLLDLLQGIAEQLGGATLAGIDGNHDNLLVYERFPEVEFFGGHAHQLREKVFHILRGGDPDRGRLADSLRRRRAVDRQGLAHPGRDLVAGGGAHP